LKTREAASTVETNHQASMELKIKMTIEAVVNLVDIKITLIFKGIIPIQSTAMI
jgi:hypothetical protein